MPRTALRRLAAAAALAVCLSSAPALHAFPLRGADAPRHETGSHELGRSLFSMILSLFFNSASAMDPNGGH